MNCLYTLNIKNKQGFNTAFVSDASRKSFISACHRWGCNYAEINHDLNPDDKICNWGKILGPKLLCGYEKLLYLDGDMMISDHAPNPFDLCTEVDTMYAVKDAQGVNDGNPIWRDCIYLPKMDDIIVKYPTFTKPALDQYFNTGFMLFNNNEIAREAFDIVGHNRSFESPTTYDQTVINMIIHNTMKVVMLPERWNYIVWSREADPNAYINHFCHSGARA